MNETNTPLPPPLGRNVSGGPEYFQADNGLFSGFEDDFKPLEHGHGPIRIVDALLKNPGRVAHEIVHGNSVKTALALLVIMIGCSLGYGLVMAAFSGGHQFWFVPVKVVAGLLLSGLICLPSLHILACLSGSRLSLSQVAVLLLMATALASLLLAGFAPVTWVFSQSTGTVFFMGLLHLLFWIPAAHISLRLLKTAVGFLNGRPTRTLKIWIFTYVLVVMQMATALRPLVGEFKGVRFMGKKFFVAHWAECAKGK